MWGGPAGARPITSHGPSLGTGPFVDPQQLTQLVRAARVARRAQAPGAGQQSAPALPASVLEPTDPFAAGVAPQTPVLVPGPDAAKAAAIEKLRQAQANRQATQAIVDLGPQTKAPARIPRAAAVPEVKPNLGWRVNDPKRVRTTLDGLMRGKGELPPPRAARYLTQAEEQQTAPAAYSETTTGPVAEHEAIISVIENRRLSGQRQYVDRGQEATVDNIIHAHTQRGMHQFQGIDNKAYRGFGTRHHQEAQNARTAAGENPGPRAHPPAPRRPGSPPPPRKPPRRVGGPLPAHSPAAPPACV